MVPKDVNIPAASFTGCDIDLVWYKARSEKAYKIAEARSRLNINGPFN